MHYEDTSSQTSMRYGRLPLALAGLLLVAAFATLEGGPQVRVLPGGRLSAPAPPEPAPTNYAPGSASCSSWLEAERLYAGAERVAWNDLVTSSTRRAFVAGYLTAANDPVVKRHILGQLVDFTSKPVDFVGSPVFRDVEAEIVFGAISAFCERHPTESLNAALQSLLVNLKAR